MKYIKKIFLVFVLINTHVLMASGASIISDSRYSALKQEFLNVDPMNFTEVSVATMSSLDRAKFLDGSSSFGFHLGENSRRDMDIYGANHLCSNAEGQVSACWFATGGEKGAWNAENCGQQIGEEYTNNLVISSKVCSTPNTEWSSLTFWLNAFDNNDYISEAFPDGKEMPLNRMCVEVEWPDTSSLNFQQADIASNSALGQVVNPNVASKNLREITFEVGTYTAPKTNNDGYTVDDEVGGTYQNGGSHFYHKPTGYGSYPTDKIYAVNSNTLVACISDIPTGVRSGMRPTYAANPLLTVVGDDANGITNGLSYINYLTRAYFSFNHGAIANYPFDIKINKFWLMYEENEIFALGGRGSTLGQGVAQSNQPVDYPFTVYNRANEDRTYRVFMSMGGVQPLSQTKENFKLYRDLNNNGLVDFDDIEMSPYSLLILSAHTDADFIIRQTVDFDNIWHGVLTRHERKFSQGTVTFQEVGRMRSASYAVRTWEGDAEKVEENLSFIESARYPSETSEWFINRQYNNELDVDNNPNLIRNSPDFIKTIQLLDKALPVYPASLKTRKIN